MSSGYIGTQKWKHGDSTRALIGLGDLRFDFGSRVHPMARVGIFIGAGLHVDTLKSSYRDAADVKQSNDDRSAQVILPAFGGFVDFGGQNFPARSHLSVQYASSRFVYVSKDQVSSYGKDGLGNEYSIINDSLQLLWMSVGHIPFDEHVVKPGLLFGFSTNSGKLHWPDEDSDPFNMDYAIDGGNFNLNELYFGIGAGFEASNYADLFIEYVFNSASLKYGKYFDNSTKSPKSQGLHSFALGVSTPMHKYLSIPFSITPRIACFISESAGAIEGRHINTKPLNLLGSKSKMTRYEPQTFLENKESISGFTLGIDAQSPDTRFGGSFHTTFLNKGGRSGIDMGFVFAFAIPGPSLSFSE